MIRKWRQHGVGPLQDIFLLLSDVPGILNVEADQKSWKSELRTDLKLHESVFGAIQNYLESLPSVDLFASRKNAKLSRFFCLSTRPKSSSEAFCVSVHNFVFYCFLTFSCIGNVLQKIICGNDTGILVPPH